jgi:hypothetical protein
MGQAIPRQQPAVVLRSHFNQLRALLAVALIAMAGLTIAVVVLATDDDADTVSGPAATTRHDGGSEERSRGIVPACPPRPGWSCSPSARSDGGPEEGSADVSPSQPRVTQQGFPAVPGGTTEPPAGASRSQAGVKDYSRDGATGDYAHGPLPPDAPAKDYSKKAATGD